ncbi:MAG: molybdopterin-dependent oxidoreductase [Flavobacteriales bacterium]|nr:molybdopterin-dependent oxidoreductase [Flavobacteriales bacterium]PIV94105.1 MAG: nitrate reductase [Flavobacteriaceae bacterium CG17_big_fil_post_rev_8_21_14_2_50_33_15]PIY11754.1 MAG: nitrate reductase [Flavobacteriaceae bacterium CG_4_10_14_3_um_filter_33_47]PJB17280.1 MAG: nitrate reductase [Flavobacteriaceae bacterium CG_4_9_14_3_um_filter_33_16]NCP59278.1 molybdopterin-dependent oxidoreductase [Flavobacteriales bacterium]
MTTSRRKFIKISALGIGGLATTSSAFNMFGVNPYLDAAVKENIAKKFVRSATYCEVCFWKCAAWAYTDEEGAIKKIIGNEDDTHCNGRLCPRGTGGVGMYSDEDRLKTPLIRTTINGEETYREATWEEALDLIASKFKTIKETYGPESFALLKHGSPGSHLEHLFQAYGSDTIAEPAYAQCRGPRETGFGLTFGSWIGSPEPTDIRDTKCLVLIGSHIGENMHNSQVQEMSDAIDNGATIITVDPRFSTAASKSKHWLAIKPATDIALLLSWMHVLIEEGIYNKDYVEKYGFGFDQLKAYVKQFTPEWAYGITTIKPEEIRKTARIMAAAAPSVIVHPGRHVVWYGDDSQRERAMAILNGLLGSWGNRGGFYFKESLKVPKYPHPEYPEPKWGWKEIGEKYPFAEMGITSELIKATLPSEDNKYPIKAWMIAGTNLINTLPQREKTIEAINALEFLVVIDTMPMEITGYADVVLPECTYLERYDEIRSATNRTPSIAVRIPAVKPKYDSKPAWWISKQIGDRIGLGAYFDYNDFEEVIEWQLNKLGTSLDEMKKIGVKNFERTSGPLFLEEGQNYEFYTPSGKIEFYSQQLANKGFDPMPVYTAHPEPPQGFYRLNYGRSPMHTFSRTINNPNLSDLKSENLLWVNPKVARILGLKKNQEVWLKNQDDILSTFSIKVRVTERIRWDSVYMYHGFGHNNEKLSRAFGKGISDTELISQTVVDPLMGGTGLRGNFVSILTENPHKNSEI